VADVALRAKVTLLTLRGGGLAAAGELRLPTGDEKNLLGTGKASVRIIGIGSIERGRMSLHGNAAIVAGGISQEFDIGSGASVAVHPRLTLAAEILSRRVPELGAIDVTSAPHPALAGVDTLRLSRLPGAGTITNAVTGLKWNVTRTVVLGGHLMWSLTNGGLTSPVTPTLAFEYAF
jgi:hypothetical protein